MSIEETHQLFKTNNTTEDTIYDDIDPSLLNLNISINIITTTIAIPGNLLLLIIFYKFKKLRDLNNFAISVLSATDFLRYADVAKIVCDFIIILIFTYFYLYLFQRVK